MLSESAPVIPQNCFRSAYLESIDLPDCVTSLGSYAFGTCSKLKSVTFPESLDSIAANCFTSCTALTSAVLPEGLKTIEASAFYNCTALETVSLPSTLTSLGNYAFSECTALKSVTYKTLTPPTIIGTHNVFSNINESCVLYVPYDCIEAYENNNWGHYFSIIEEMKYFTVDPADGDEVEDIMQITATSLYGIALSSENAYESITLENEDGETVAIVVSAELSEDSLAYTLTLSERFYVHSPVFPAGTYTLNIPVGVFALKTLDEKEFANDSLSVTYTLVGDEPIPTLGFDPAPVDENGEGGTVEELHTINISVVDGLSLDFNIFPGRITLRDADGEQVAKGNTCEGLEDEDGYVSCYVLTLNNTITNAGEYTLHIPAGAFTLTHGTGDTSDIDATSVTFVIPGEETTIAGVASSTDSSVTEVYNLAGQKIASPMRGQVSIVRMSDGTVKKVLTK